ncbi:MAG: ankyrin repeat domain-containing protein [Gemmatimonadaceae bacterium]
MSSPFSRLLPSRPDLEQQRTQAKELLERFTAGETESLARVRAALPDKTRITLADAQFVLAREYGFVNWAALKQHIESIVEPTRSPIELAHDAFQRCDANALRRVLAKHAELRARINDPVFSFDSPAVVAFAQDDAMVEVLLEFGADPNRKSDWWAGGFHPLYVATGAAAERLLAAGAIPDACAAAHLDRVDLLTAMIADDPACVHMRGGDGQTPLHFARSREVADLLLGAGADIDARDVDHRATPAQWMLARARNEGRYDLAQYLVDRGAEADIFLVAALGLTDRARAMLERAPALLDLRTGRGEYGEQPPSSHHIYFWSIGDSHSPLDVAARFEQLDTLQVMKEFASPLRRLLVACRMGDEPSARTMLREHPGIMASMQAEDHRAISDAAWQGDARAVALMLDLGFDPRTRGQDSGTALHCAAWEGSPETVRVLLRHADRRELVAIRDAHHQATPLGWCCHGSQHGNTSHDHAAVAEQLLEAGAQLGQDTSTASSRVMAVLARWQRGR